MRTSISEVRRRELIEAAYRVFLTSGINGLTTARICREAGMSPSILVYYFKGKDDVLYWMVRHANRVLMDRVVLGMKSSATQWERLMAIIDGNFPAELFNRNTANAWLSFYVASSRDAKLAHLQTLFRRRLASNLHSCVRDVLERREATQLAQTVSVLIDGCWLHKGGSEAAIMAPDARALIEQQVRALLGRERVRRLCETKVNSANARAGKRPA